MREVGLLKGARTKRCCGKVRWRQMVAIIAGVWAVYVALYAYRAVKINMVHKTEWIKASELPENCAEHVVTYGCPLDDEAVGRVLVLHCDMDGDGMDELLTDAGDLGRGTANSWWAIWRKGRSGAYHCLGTFYCDQFAFVPPWTIYGMPYVWCCYDHRSEWVPWKNGRYEGKGGTL